VRAKQRAIRIVRGARILPILERIRFLAKVVVSQRVNRNFRRKNPTEPMPPRWLTYDAFSDVSFERYWNDGQQIAAYIGELISASTVTPWVVCEWGCGPSRTLRHLAKEPLVKESLGTDYNRASISWCREQFPGTTWIQNALEPPLDIPDGHVDLAFAISVLTHLSEEHCLAWMRELRRIVRRDGLIMLTVHGDWYRDTMLLPDEQVIYDDLGYVGRGNVKEGSRGFVAFHSPRYMIDTLARGLDVVRHTRDAPVAIAGRQEVWVFRNQ